MSDAFEDVRREIDEAQTRLWRMEDRYSSAMQALGSRARAMEITTTEYQLYESEMRQEIARMEHHIIRLKQRHPPYAKDLGNGVIALLPALEPIDPRTPV